MTDTTPETETSQDQSGDRPETTTVHPESVTGPTMEPHRIEPEPEPEPEEWTHYVHLADGRVIKHNMTEPLGASLDEKNGEGDDAEVTHSQIIGVYPR